MLYHFRIHNDPDGFWAECIELEGCVTQADTLEELHENMKEALYLYLAEPKKSDRIFPMPEKEIGGENVAGVFVDPRIAFALKIRTARRMKGLTQKKVAKLLGMKNIYSYQRLERLKDANPSLTMLAKIKEVFPEIQLDEILAGAGSDA